LSKTVVVYCGECGNKLYTLTGIAQDKKIPCQYCKSVSRSYVMYGSPREHDAMSAYTSSVLRKNPKTA